MNNAKFKPAKLSTLAYASNFTVWHYRSGEDNVEIDGYFDTCAQLRTSDLLIVSSAASTGPRTRFYTVTKAEKRFVIVKPMGKEHLAHTREIIKEKGNDDEQKDGNTKNGKENGNGSQPARQADGTGKQN